MISLACISFHVIDFMFTMKTVNTTTSGCSHKDRIPRAYQILEKENDVGVGYGVMLNLVTMPAHLC